MCAAQHISNCAVNEKACNCIEVCFSLSFCFSYSVLRIDTYFSSDLVFVINIWNSVQNINYWEKTSKRFYYPVLSSKQTLNCNSSPDYCYSVVLFWYWFLNWIRVSIVRKKFQNFISFWKKINWNPKKFSFV